MSFQPVVPFAGVSGWAFLQRARAHQQALFNEGRQMQRDVAYFRRNISAITDAGQLVSDRRLLRVALGAFGLDGDIDNRAFIRKVLEDGTLNRKALSHKLADKRYLALSRAFGFGDSSHPKTRLPDFAGKITTAYQKRQFEVAIGAKNPEMRLALGLERDLSRIAQRQTSDTGRWFAVMGTPSVRRVFETALGLPAGLAKLPLERQLKAFRTKAEAVLGHSDISRLAGPQAREKLVRLFLVRSQAAAPPVSARPASAAVALLQSAGFGVSLL